MHLYSLTFISNQIFINNISSFLKDFFNLWVNPANNLLQFIISFGRESCDGKEEKPRISTTRNFLDARPPPNPPKVRLILKNCEFRHI